MSLGQGTASQPGQRACGRVTLVNRFGYPDDSPTSRLMHDLASDLAASRPDLEIRVIASNRLYGHSTTRLPARETVGRVGFARVWAPAGSGGLLQRALGYGLFYVQAMLQLLLGLRRGELVICMSDPPMFGVLAALATQARGARLVQWVQDLYPDVVQSAGLTRSAPLMNLLLRLRRAAYRASERLVVIGEGMCERLLRDGSGCPVEIIPNWAGAGDIRPVPREALPLARAWLPPCGFVVGYFGNLGFAHSFQSSLEAAARLMPEPGIQFLWVGDGSRRPAFQKALQEMQLTNVHWQGKQPFDRMPEILGIADIHLVMLDPKFDEVLVPSKIYSALAAGRGLPFLGSGSSEVARLIRQHDIGVVVDLDDVDGIVRAIHGLAADPERCRGRGERARQLLETHFERGRAMKRWQQLIGQLLPLAT